jgi:hypothetical protein
MIANKQWCIACCSVMLSRQRKQAGIRVCAQCDPTVPDRIENIVMPMFVKEIGFPASSLNNIRLGGTQCDARIRIPDACWISDDRIVFLEIDEHGHEDRLPSCEIAKVIDQTVSVRKEYPNAIVAHFRFNPCEFDHRPMGVDDRISNTASDIRLFLRGVGEWMIGVPYLFYYYYPQKSYFQIEYALREAADAVQVMVVGEQRFFRANNFEDIDTSWNAKK